MRTIYYLFLGIIVVTDPSPAQWEVINSPVSGYINDIVVKNDSIYVTTTSEFLFSADEGLIWRTIPTPFYGKDAFTEYNNMFFISSHNLLYMSSDFGQTWQQIDSLNNGNVFKSIYASDSVVLTGTEYGIFKSTDYGKNWLEMNNGLTSKNIGFIKFLNNKIYVGTGSGIYFWSDSINAWYYTNTGIDGPVYDIAAINDVYFAVTGNALFKSTDGGLNWKKQSNYELGGLSVHIKSDTLFVGCGSPGVAYSTDLGDTWTTIRKGLMGGRFVWNISSNERNIFFGTPKGLLKFSSNRSTFESALSSCMLYYGARNIHSIGNKIVVHSEFGVFSSIDKGETWYSSNNGLASSVIQEMVKHDDNLIAGTYDGGLCISTDGGLQWNIFGSGLIDTMIRTVTAYGNYIALRTTNEPGVLLSSDGGISWKKIDTTNGWYNFNKNILLTDQGLYFSSSTSKCFLAAGDSIVQKIPGRHMLGFFKTPMGIYGNALYADIVKIVKQDTAWTTQEIKVGSGEIRYIYSHGGRIFASDFAGIYMTQTNDTTWSTISEGLDKNSIVISIASDDQYLYAGDQLGYIWRRPIDQLMNAQQNATMLLPFKFILHQNYPNPFNPRTKIKYDIPSTTQVQIQVFDMVGRLVANVLDETVEAGTHLVDFNAVNVSAGIYFCRMKANGYSQITKMVLLK
jgi:photosystem II stability/assembly factor-like uncharacterized protein